MAGSNAGSFDAYVARYDSTGNRLWIRQFGTSEYETINGVAFDGAGALVVAGYTEGSLGGPAAGGWDIFLASFDLAGNQLWIRQLGTSFSEDAFAVVHDGAGRMMVAGWTGGDLGGPNAGQIDAYVARFAGPRRGDLNCDGAFNGADIDPFFLALGDPKAYAKQFPYCGFRLADMNGDGVVNGADIDPFFQCLGAGSCP